MSNSLQPHGLYYTWLPYPSLSPGVCWNSCLLSRWCHLTISSSIAPLSSCHSLLQWTMLCQNSPQWPILLGWPCMTWLIVLSSYTRLWSMWSFWLVSCHCSFYSSGMGLKFLLLLSAFWWMTIRGLCKLPDGRHQLWGKLGLALVGRAMLSKSLIQFSADGWDCAPSL